MWNAKITLIYENKLVYPDETFIDHLNLWLRELTMCTCYPTYRLYCSRFAVRVTLDFSILCRSVEYLTKWNSVSVQQVKISHSANLLRNWNDINTRGSETTTTAIYRYSMTLLKGTEIRDAAGSAVHPGSFCLSQVLSFKNPDSCGLESTLFLYPKLYKNYTLLETIHSRTKYHSNRLVLLFGEIPQAVPYSAQPLCLSD